MPIYTTRAWFKKLPEPSDKWRAPKPEDTDRFDAQAWLGWFEIERGEMKWENECKDDEELQLRVWCVFQGLDPWKTSMLQRARRAKNIAEGKLSTKIKGNVAWRGYRDFDIG